MHFPDIDKIKDFFKNQPVVRAWLFGSFARGEATDNSDVDILVDFDTKSRVSLFRHAAMQLALGDLLNRNVDLVNERSLYPEVSDSIYKDRILIYERDA